MYEEVFVPLAVGGIPLVRESSDDRSGQSALRIIVIDVRGESLIESGSLKTIKRNVRVVARAYGVFLLRTEAESVVAVAVLVFGIYEKQVFQRHVALQLVEAERPATIFHRVRGLGRTLCLHVDGGSRSILRG